jgi:DNA-binding MarR family transcriptional regulator
VPDPRDNTRAGYQSAIEHEVAELYRSAKSRVKSIASKYHPDLQPVGYGILRFIFTTEPVRSQDIAASLGMDKGAVSRQVTALRQLGLVDTRIDPDDRRATLLVISDKARAVRVQVRGETSSGYSQILDDWNDRDIREFARLLTSFNSAIHN